MIYVSRTFALQPQVHVQYSPNRGTTKLWSKVLLVLVLLVRTGVWCPLQPTLQLPAKTSKVWKIQHGSAHTSWMKISRQHPEGPEYFMNSTSNRVSTNGAFGFCWRRKCMGRIEFHDIPDCKDLPNRNAIDVPKNVTEHNSEYSIPTRRMD